jgi:hypothetical protein
MQVITEAKNAIMRTEEKDKVVNIDSKKVKILNAFSEPKVYDLVCTCIEIDAKGLVDLIFNFRKLCSSQGKFAKLTPEETIKILETTAGPEPYSHPSCTKSYIPEIPEHTLRLRHWDDVPHVHN